MTFTNLMIAVNVGVFLLLNIVLNVFDPRLFEGLLHMLGLSQAGFFGGALWQPLTSMFLHGGAMHILFNMIALWSIGSPIERDIGFKRFAWLYILSGLGGAAAVLIFTGNPYNVTVGASGAVMGLLGALAIFYPNSMLLLFFIPMKARTAAILFGGASILMSIFDVLPFISHFGHLGGLIAGVIFSKYSIGKIRRSRFKEMFTNPSGSPGAAGYGARRDAMREFMRNPRGFTRAGGGGFIDVEAAVVDDPDQKEEPNKKEQNGETGDESSGPTKRLYYDPEQGKFFFK